MSTEQGHPPPGKALSAAQRRLWLAYRIEPDSPEFTAPWAGRLTGDLDLDALRRAWRGVVERHAELRLRLTERNGEPQRSQWPVDEFGLVVRDSSPDRLPAELERAVTRPFPLVDGRLVDATLLRLGPGEHVLVIGAHHAVMDGRSLAVILRDLFDMYTDRPVGPPGRPYTDYVDAPDAVPAGEKFDAWIEDLRVPEAAEPLGLAPTGHRGDRAGALVRVPVPPDVWQRVRGLSRALRTTPQVVGLSAYAAALSRYMDRADVVVGSTMDTRSGDFAETVGMFINPAPVRVRVDDVATVADYCRSVHRGLLRAYSMRNVPFEEVVRQVRTTPDPSRTPIFQVLFNFEADEPDIRAGALRVSHLRLPVQVSKYDLTMVLRDRGADAELLATYRSSRYSATQIERFTAHVATLLAGLCEAGATLGRLPMLSDADRTRLAELGAGATLPQPTRLVPDAVAAVARAEPGRPAVTDDRTELTYGELLDRADAVAATVRTHRGAGPLSVGVLGEPSADLVTAVFGVWRAGAAYVPLNPTYPPARISAMLADAGVDLVLGDASWRDRLPGVRVLTPAEATAPEAAPGPAVTVRPTDAAYVIYTSGTTGEPKGVVVDHGALAASTAARHATYGGRGTFLLVSPLSFDSSMAGLWGTLSSGGRLVVAGTDDVRDPERAVDLIDRHAVTNLLSVPAFHAGLLDRAERTDPKRLASLQLVVTAGEALPAPLVERHFAVLPDTRLANEYGPTEATVWSTVRVFDRPAPVDIGGPVPGATVSVRDRTGALTPPGAVGELYVGGAGVARGYLGRPEATAAAFVTRPDGGRMYRTGDFVRWNDRAGLDFLGRRDQLVKIRGHRVELGAVETVLRAEPTVADVAVLPTGNGANLVAFVVPAAGYAEQALRERLSGLLPPAMLPGLFVPVPELPRTPHGKVDRSALRVPAEPDPVAAEQPAVGDDLRAAVLAAWCETLEVPTVATDVNFFDAGGHSLLMVTLQMALEDRLDVTISVVDLFTATTIDEQVALIRGTPSSSAPPAEAAGTDLRRARLAAARRRGGGDVA